MRYSTDILGLVLSFFLFSFGSIRAQEIRILDLDSREPIGNVVIYNNNRTKTVLSDIDGRCNLEVFGNNERITFRHISYESYRTTPAQLRKKGSRIYLTIKPEQLDEVVMSISKWEQQKKDIPQKIVSINARSIAFGTPQTSADLLKNSGQVFVQKSQLGGGSPMIRGFATNRILLSVDGVRMNNAIFRGGNIQNVISIDPFNVKNSEIIFGPGSVIYGSDAIGGVMNFLTVAPQFSEQDSLYFSAHANYRIATANIENTVHADFNFGKKKWAFLSSFSYTDFSDLKMGSNGPDSYLRNTYVRRINGTDTIVSNDNPLKQLPTAYNQVNFMQKISHRSNNRWNYDLGFHYSQTSDYARYDRLIRPDDSGDGLRSAEWFYGPQKWFMGNLQLEHLGRGKFYDRLKITTAYQRFEESRNERNFQDPNRFTTEEKLDAISANIDFENKKIGNLGLYYGLEYIFNKVGSDGSQQNIETAVMADAASRYPDGSTWQSAAGYLSAEFKTRPNFTLLTGLRFNHVWIDAEFDTTFFPFPFTSTQNDNGALTGSLGFSWFPRANFQVTMNGSTGFRSPNIDDIGKVFESEPGSVVVPNPDLKPEYAYNMELGIRKNFKDKVVLKGAAFYTYLDNALVRRDFMFNGQSEIIYNGELSNVQAIQNAANAYVYGFEASVEAFLTENFSLRAHYTYADGIEEDDTGEDSAARHVPPSFGDIHILWKNQRLQTDLFVNFNGEIAFEDLALSERNKPYLYDSDLNGNPFSPSWYTLNLRSQYQISNSLKVNFSIENITDQRYRSYSSGITGPGINFILGLGISL
ncbi:MAG: TonB-dependent receptor plug domain-containing protein [Flavobacteriaceae bacterium]